jgi:hypothetical protein
MLSVLPGMDSTHLEDLPDTGNLRQVFPAGAFNCFYCNAIQVLSGLNSVMAFARLPVSLPRFFS